MLLVMLIGNDDDDDDVDVVSIQNNHSANDNFHSFNSQIHVTTCVQIDYPTAWPGPQLTLTLTLNPNQGVI